MQHPPDERYHEQSDGAAAQETWADFAQGVDVALIRRRQFVAAFADVMSLRAVRPGAGECEVIVEQLEHKQRAQSEPEVVPEVVEHLYRRFDELQGQFRDLKFS